MLCILGLHPNPQHSVGSERKPKQVTGEKLTNPGRLKRSDYKRLSCGANNTKFCFAHQTFSALFFSEHVNQTPSGSDLNSQLLTPSSPPSDSCCCLWHQLSYFSTIFPSDTHIFLSQTRPLCCWDENSR